MHVCCHHRRQDEFAISSDVITPSKISHTQSQILGQSGQTKYESILLLSA